MNFFGGYVPSSRNWLKPFDPAGVGADKIISERGIEMSISEATEMLFRVREWEAELTYSRDGTSYNFSRDVGDGDRQAGAITSEAQLNRRTIGWRAGGVYGAPNALVYIMGHLSIGYDHFHWDETGDVFGGATVAAPFDGTVKLLVTVDAGDVSMGGYGGGGATPYNQGVTGTVEFLGKTFTAPIWANLPTTHSEPYESISCSLVATKYWSYGGTYNETTGAAL